VEQDRKQYNHRESVSFPLAMPLVFSSIFFKSPGCFQDVFFSFLFQLAAISERFELECSDWAHFLCRFKFFPDLTESGQGCASPPRGGRAAAAMACLPYAMVKTGGIAG
jgi:hypothetical protein